MVYIYTLSIELNSRARSSRNNCHLHHVLLTGVTQKARRLCLCCCTVMLLLLVSSEICIILVFICLDLPGQGIVYETMGMSELPDYSTKVIIMV